MDFEQRYNDLKIELKRQRDINRKLDAEIAAVNEAYIQNKMIFDAYIAYFTARKGGVLKINREKINKMVGKYKFKTIITDKEFVIKQIEK